MDLSRRSFLRGVLALSVTPALNIPSFASVPVIRGDGIHDDWAGLQAMLDGEPFRVEGENLVAVDGIVSGGPFAVSDTLTFRRSNIRFSAIRLHALPEFRGDCAARFLASAQNIVFDYLELNWRDARRPLSAGLVFE